MTVEPAVIESGLMSSFYIDSVIFLDLYRFKEGKIDVDDLISIINEEARHEIKRAIKETMEEYEQMLKLKKALAGEGGADNV